MVRRGLTVERHAQSTAYIAVTTVTGDQVIGTNSFFDAIRRVHAQGYAGGILIEVVHVTGEQGPHVIKALEPVEQYGIDLRLNKRIAPRPAEFIGHGLDISETATLGREEPHGVPRCGVWQYLVHQAEGLDGAQRFVIDADCTGVIDQLVELFYHQHIDADLAEVVGNCQPYGA